MVEGGGGGGGGGGGNYALSQTGNGVLLFFHIYI